MSYFISTLVGGAIGFCAHRVYSTVSKYHPNELSLLCSNLLCFREPIHQDLVARTIQFSYFDSEITNHTVSVEKVTHKKFYGYSWDLKRPVVFNFRDIIGLVRDVQSDELITIANTYRAHSFDS